ncbi:uncharacterized protein LOC141863372 isoform X2 [Acropora palmata]|uniref:uncharacterized protein LOC141863372 isoform X2 n=1 Tax=Acropora palmata TaxID=6131 RepID=UPI003DA0D61C
MPPKKKPLEDARKRLREKLNNVEEQSEYICQFISDLVRKASAPAKDLLEEKDRKKFFQKYSSVSQELEKCLDCLLLMSDSMIALGEEQTPEELVAECTSDKENRDNQQITKAKQNNNADKKDSGTNKEEQLDDVQSKSKDTEPGSLTLSHPVSAVMPVESSLESLNQDHICNSQLYNGTVNLQKDVELSKTQSTLAADVNVHKDLQPAKTQIEHATGKKCSVKTQDSSCDSKSLTNGTQSSQKGLNMISSLIDVDPTKEYNSQSQTTDGSSSRLPKSSRRRGSSSSTGALSDIIQDLRISQREAKMAADNLTAEVHLVTYPFKNGQKLDVIITEVVSPWELWLQPIGSQLDLLMEEMCMHYAKLGAAGYKGGLAVPPAKGDFCCAKFAQDDTWYRVQVVDVEESQTGPIVSVVSVDDGNREKVGLSHMRPLEEKFSKLPCQGMCCALSGIRPVHPTPEKKSGFSGTASLWSHESIDWLRKTVSGKQLGAYLTKTNDLIIADLFVPPPKNPRNKGAVSGLPALHYSIAEMMINVGMAQRIVSSDNSHSTASSSPLSVVSNDSLSASGSTGTVSITSNTQDETHGDEAVNINEVSVETDISTSSRDTVATSPIRKLHAVGERQHSSTDKAFQGKNLEDEEMKNHVNLECKISREDGENQMELQGVISDDNAAMFQEPVLLPGPHASFIPALPPVNGPVCLQMLMSHVVSPSEFYVHLVTPDAGILDVLMNDINKVYESDTVSASSEPGSGYQPQVDDHCCARFNEDGRWYRGLVTNLRSTKENKGPEHSELEVQVFHVDFGSSEWVSPENVKPLEARFLSLPAQVVRCRLANLKPEVSEDLSRASEQSPSPMPPPVVQKSGAPLEQKQPSEERPSASLEPVSDTTSGSPVTGKPRKKDRRRRKRLPKINLKDKIIRAAGDESYDSSELSEFEASQSKIESSKKDRLEEKDALTDAATFPEKYLVPSPGVSPEKPFSFSPMSNEVQDDKQWASGSAELLSGLIDDNRKLVGYMVPWDPWIFQKLFFPEAAAGEERVDLTFKKPVLNLNLYDTTGEEDIFINQVLVDTGIAVFVEDAAQETEAMTLRFSLDDLQNAAFGIEGQGLTTDNPANINSLTTSPTSPLSGWNPMQEDFHSSKNTYSVNTDDLDIAFQGYQDLSRRVCRFFQSRSGCWRGNQCPNLHSTKGEEVHELVEVFCDNLDSSVTMPDIGTWVAVRVTAVFNPGHFWVQFPYGTEPIEKRIMAAITQSDELDSDKKKEDDDLVSLMDKMSKFYSRNICQDPRRILPAVGELCAAKYSKDNKWYRARITSMREEDLQVFFVDFGNSEWTREKNVKRMLPHFLHLPFQALECFLGNVEPTRESQENGRKFDWSKDAMETFTSLTEDKVLIAHILSKAWNQTIYVDLWDTEGDSEIHINKVLIEKGFAQETDHPVNNPWNMEGTVTQSRQKVVGLPG